MRIIIIIGIFILLCVIISERQNKAIASRTSADVLTNRCLPSPSLAQSLSRSRPATKAASSPDEVASRGAVLGASRVREPRSKLADQRHRPVLPSGIPSELPIDSVLPLTLRTLR